MAYKGYVGEIPAGDGGANFDQNPGRVPITDLIDADGVITQDGLLQKEPGAVLFDRAGIAGTTGGAPYAQATLSGDRSWGMIGATLRGASIAFVPASTMTSNSPVGVGPSFKVELTVPAGGIAAGSCIVVSSHLFTIRPDSTVVCTDDVGNTYNIMIGGIWPPFGPVITRLFVALNVLALSAGQKITLSFDSMSMSLNHVAVGNQFTGITTLAATNRVQNEGFSDTAYVLYGSVMDLPSLLIAAGGLADTASTTVTPNYNFIKCGEATNGPGSTHSRGWQQYRIDLPDTSTVIVGLQDWRPNTSVQRIISTTLGGRIYKEVAGNLDAVLLVSGLSHTARPGRFVEGGQEAPGNNRKLFYFNGVDPVQVLSGDGAVTSAISKEAADWDPYWPLGGMIQRNHLAAWGNLNDPHRLYLSTVADHEDFQTNTGADVTLTYSCYPSVGDRLYSGAKHLGLLWLFKWPRGIFWLDDSDPDTTLWSLQMHTEALGCAPTPFGALTIDNDVMILSSTGYFHLLSAVQGGVVRASNLSMAMHHAKWLRDHINLSKLSQAISVWYPHKKWAIWGLPSTGSSINDLVLLFDFSDVNEAGELPRLFVSNRDNIDALALRLESDQIERPMLGEGGLVWLLDRDARNKDGSGYLGRYQTARTDFHHVEPRLAAREKIFDHLELVKTPTSGTLTVKVEIDGTLTKTLSFDLSKRRQRRRIDGSGYELSLICENEVADVNFLIERHLVLFREGEEGRI